MNRNVLKTLIKILAVGVLFLGALQNASAASLSLVGLDDVSSTSSTGFNTGSDSGLGAGVLLGMHIGGRFSFNTGFLYYTREWSDTTSGSNTLKATVYTIPFLFDWHLRIIHFGVGGYYSSYTGSLSESGATNNSSLSYSSYGISQSDVGFLGDVGLHIPLGGASLRLDALFYSGNTNLATNSNNKFEVRDIVYMAGFSFPIAGPMPHRMIEGHTQ
jgi:hypothetical protein